MKPAQIAAMILGALLVLYPLSTGPVCRACYTYPGKGPRGISEAVNAFYGPLVSACYACPPLGRVMEWYIDFWMRGVDSHSPR